MYSEFQFCFSSSHPEPVAAEAENPGDIEQTLSDEDINVLNRFKNTFREDVEVFLANAEQNWGKESFQKAVISFGRKFGKLNRSNENTQIRVYHDFGDKSRKNSNRMKVGSQHISRRTKPNRGTGVSQYGRPHKQRKRKSLISEDEPDVEFHSVPQAKRQKNKQKHSLKESVKENRPSAKRH